jgi:ketosteroid isomerase-like protein
MIPYAFASRSSIRQLTIAASVGTGTRMRNPRRYCSVIAPLFVTCLAAVAAESDVQAIEDTYRAWVQASNDRDILKWSSFLADDPYFLPADVPPLIGKEAVLAYYEKAFADPEFALDCEQLEVEVADSGDMAWSRGVCHATFSLSDGSPGKGTSRWLKVWTKTPDGSWKGRINAWKYED